MNLPTQIVLFCVHLIESVCTQYAFCVQSMELVCMWYALCVQHVSIKSALCHNQASFSCSILKANMEVEVAIQLAHDLDETGMPCVCIGLGLLGVLLDLPERV
jgi:hypothetical protein